MSGNVLQRGLSGHIADLGVEQGVQGKTNHGRQGKSAAAGRTQVVGWAAHFGYDLRAPCCRFAPNSQRFQYPERHRSVQRRRSGP
jgi:hypothetical protein